MQPTRAARTHPFQKSERIVRCCARLILRADGTDKAKVRDATEATKGYIGTGGKVTMSPTDHMGLDLSAFRMFEIKSGDWTLVN